MENEDIFLKKLVKLSKDNVIARECLTSNSSNKKKKEDLEAKAVFEETRQEIYNMLRELSPQDRKETFDYLESNYKYLLGLCERNRASRNNMFDMFTFLSLKMFSFRNIEPLYYNYMLEQLTQKASNALWCSSEDDYKLASMQIKGNIDSLDQNDKEKFDKLLSNRMENAKNNTYCPLSQEEYTLKEHQQRAYKLLKYLSEYSNEEKNAQSM